MAFAAHADFLRENYAATFRAGDFIVSPAFGIAFDPSDSNWVTALPLMLTNWHTRRRNLQGSGAMAVDGVARWA